MLEQKWYDWSISSPDEMNVLDDVVIEVRRSYSRLPAVTMTVSHAGELITDFGSLLWRIKEGIRVDFANPHDPN